MLSGQVTPMGGDSWRYGTGPRGTDVLLSFLAAVHRLHNGCFVSRLALSQDESTIQCWGRAKVNGIKQVTDHDAKYFGAYFRHIMFEPAKGK